MKLKEYNIETLPPGAKSSVAAVSVNQKNGLFNFTEKACELIGLKGGFQVIFLQDEEDTDNWYVEVVADKGFSLRKKPNVTAGLLFNNVSMAKKIFSSLDIAEQSHRFLIAGQPTKFGKRTLWGIIAVKSN